MTIACVIPARLNSSRFPRKLLATAQGKTVLQRTFENAARCEILDALYVATDNEEIADHIKGLGGEVLWTSSIPRDGTERICEALQNHEGLKNSSLLINLQGDHPCVAPSTLEALVKALQNDPLAVAATPVTSLKTEEEFLSSHVVKCVFDAENNALYFSRSPIPHNNRLFAYAHIGIYCYRTSFLKKLSDLPATPLQQAENLEQLKILESGHRIKVSIVNEPSLSVDIPQDLVTLEDYLCKQNTFL